MDTALLLQNLINGLSIGSVYALFALGYTLVFSILGIINFSHSAIFTLGAYLTLFLTGQAVGFNGVLANQRLPFQLPFILALLGACILTGLLSIVIEFVAFRPLRNRGADRLLAVVSSLGIALIIVNLIQYLVGAEGYRFPADPFGIGQPLITLGDEAQPIRILTSSLMMFGVSVVILILLTVMINRTMLGKALQAVAEDTTTSQLLGINNNRLIMLTFFISGFLGGLAGALVASARSIPGPYFGTTFGLKGLSVIVLGGLGNVPGAVVGGFVIGLTEAFIPAEYSSYKDAVAFVLLFLILLFRPQGLLGRAQIQKV